MNDILNQFKKVFKVFGLNLDLFPGIPIALFPLYFFLSHYKEVVLKIFHADQMNEFAQTAIIAMLVMILGICVYKLSGFILDPFYDKISPSKTKKDSELNTFINTARKKWESKDSIYAKQNVSIYKDTVKLMKTTADEEYKEVKLTLAVSKLFRIIVIPFILLGIANILDGKSVIRFIILGIAILCLAISFSYRVEQSKMIYKWFLTQNDKKAGDNNK